MDAVALILTLLTAFNLSVMVMKAYGDKFPQPNVRARHAGWLQGWRNTQKPLQRYWIQVAIMFAIMLLFNFAGLMFLGFLVFVRLIVFVLGYKRAKLQIALATPPQTQLATGRQQIAQAEALQSHAPATERSITPQAKVTQMLPPLVGKSFMSKGVWVLLIVIVACATAVFLGYLYSRSHSPDYDANGYYSGSPPDNSPTSRDTTAALSGALGDSGDRAHGSVPQAAQVQQPTQAPSQQAMLQAVQRDTAAKTRGDSSKVTPNTYGNVVASFYPGKSPLDAIGDALVSIHSELTVLDMAPSGYPEYQVECQSNGECVGGTGTPMGAVVDVAKEMFPVNPADVDQGGITCGKYICEDGKGKVIGRAPVTTY
ncbi:hypothetical protein [Rhodanobacter hydrolyticus]|uniref:Uncharacterized protein n=1 Tax=Rhodanobacter hydrolyticus TaxID=2250595 RepID=A0ABW8J274_9GAMM